MNCNDFAAILDERRDARLPPAERRSLDEHLGHCEPCALAWAGRAALASMRVPSTPPFLLQDVLTAIRIGTAPRRARPARVVLAGTLLVAGAALAAASFVAWETSRDVPAEPAAPERSDLGADPAAPEDSASEAPIDSPERDASAGPPQLPVAEIVPVLVARVPPSYPPAALERGREGEVQVAYTIARNGAVEDVTVVTSTHSVFEAAALEAVAQWKYLPRVVDGERVSVPDVRTVIRFALERPATRSSTTPQPAPARGDAELARAFLAVEHGLEVAWQRFAEGDLRGAELELDELRATYELARDDGRVFSFYGYIFTQYGDYGRAIGAYETALSIYEKRPGRRWQGEQLALANLYFARHQYDMALRTLLEHRVPEALPPLLTSIDALIERLRVLGVTEETL